MATPVLPRAQSAMVDNASMPAREWYDFFRSLLEFVDENSDVADEIAGILLRLEALENEDASVVIRGLQSVRVAGNATDGFLLTLQGDTNDQGNTYYYGSGPDGAKGWFPVSGTMAVTATDLAKTVGSDGVTTFALAALADAGTGALLAITRDAKGRVSGTKPVTAGSNITITDIGASVEISSTGGGGVLPIVTGEIASGQPVFVYGPDGSLVYGPVA